MVRTAKHLLAGAILLLLVGLSGCGGDDTTNVDVVSPVAVSTVFPDTARVGETITVYGQKFGDVQGASALHINGAAVSAVASWSETRIVATVPPDATTGNVTVTVDGVAGAPGYLVVPWTVENPDNLVVSPGTHSKLSPFIADDGQGGAIIVWQDARNGSGWDIYAQRVNGTGAVLWAEGGVPVVATATTQHEQRVASDGAGGAIIVWADGRNGLQSDIYAQRLSSAGVPQWAADGVPVVTASGHQVSPRLISDGAGGVILSWRDERSGSYSPYVQRFDSAGEAQWVDGGVALNSTGGALDSTVELVADGTGGALAVWADDRHGTVDLFAQRIDANGTIQWVDGGVPISTASGDQRRPQVVSDGSGGAVLVWEDGRFGERDVYAQRIDSAGATHWTADGVVVSAAAGDQRQLSVAPDGSGGAIIVWSDLRVTAGDIYAQHVDSAGASLWAADGMAVSAAAGLQQMPVVAADGAGGLVVAWEDRRDSADGSNIYAQRLTSAGRTQWTVDGLPVTTAIRTQYEPKLIADPTGGAIVVWSDGRSGNYGIYAQGVTVTGID